mgnify:CR=1 FL=1
MKYTLNEHPLEPLDKIEAEPDFDQSSFKHVDAARAELNNYCRAIVDAMLRHVSKRRKYLYVFVGIEDFREGDPSGFWHLDTTLNPVRAYENFLFVAGVNTTEFAINQLEIEEARSAKDLHDQVEALTLRKVQIPPFTIIRYYEGNVHRKPLVQKDEKRLLIRLSNTDAFKPELHFGRATTGITS